MEEVFAAQQAIAEGDADEKVRAQAKRKLDTSGPHRELLLGQICLAEGEAEQALLHFERVQLTVPKYPGLPNELGRTYAKMKRWRDAEEAFFQALEADPHNAGALQGLGMVYVATRQFREAVETLGEAVGLLYHNPLAHFHLGEAYFRVGEFEEAERSWLTCVNQAPGFKRAHKKLIQLYWHQLNAPAKAAEHQRFIDEKIKDTDEARAENEAPLPETPSDRLARPQPEAPLEAVAPEEIITVVSGLPRSGTSMLMQMLEAGGMTPLSDQKREPDESNPKGYWEYEPTLSLARDSSWLPEAKGKSVKIIAQLLPFLPQGFRYRVIFVERDLREILASQKTMLKRRGREAGNTEILAQTFQRHLDLVQRQLARRKDVEVLYLPHRSVIENPQAQAEILAGFLGEDFDAQRAAAAVDVQLHRHVGGTPIG